jgi:uncharacterized protein (DUF427 family)
VCAHRQALRSGGQVVARARRGVYTGCMATDMNRMMREMVGELRWAAANRRVRASLGEHVVADSRDARQVWEPGRVVGQYAVPAEDLSAELVEPVDVRADGPRPRVLFPSVPFSEHSTPGTAWSLRLPSGAVLAGAAFTPDDDDLAGWAILDWDAFGPWREEEVTVRDHPRDPFHRVDCLPSDRHVIARLGDVVLAETRRPVLVQETQLPQRWYIPRADARTEMLTPSPTTTGCPYKGQASYWSAVLGDTVVEDVAWSYESPLLDATPAAGMLCFYDEKVTVEVS